MNTASKQWYLRPVARWTALRSVPLRRLWRLLLAAFLLFSVIGYYTDLMNDGNTPYAVVIVMAAYSGLNACAWVYGTSRWPAPYIILLALLQFANGSILSSVSHWMIARFHLHYVPTKEGVHFAASAIFFCVITSYILFLSFIVAESKRSIRLQNELELAHDIQKTLVPVVQLRTALFEVYGVSRPSEKVGGDLVDAVALNSGHTVAYLADIAGHGLPASILMGRLKTAARTAVLECGALPSHTMLSVLLDRLNLVLPQVKEPQLYATFTGFRLGADGSVYLALAASPPIFLWSAATGAIQQLDEPQLPLGLLPVPFFPSTEVELATGDLLVVVTDGVLEVADKRGEEFGAERLKNLLGSNTKATLPEFADKLLAAAHGFGKQFDDQTMLLIRRL